MVSMRQNVSRVEESIQKLVKSRGTVEHPAMDMVDIMNAYRKKLSEDVWEQQVILKGNSQMTNTLESPSDGSLVEEDVDKAKHLQERLQVLEAENSALAMENEAQREQYERCLDEFPGEVQNDQVRVEESEVQVASHIVQALLTQKDLRDECLILQTRVLDLEQQNWILSALFQQGVRPASDLLLEKLQSKIMDLSCGDVFLSAERSKNFRLSRSLNSSQHESQLSRAAGFPMEKYPSQMSLAVPAGVYSYSSCSSSELSLSSACSECSNGSFTWKEGHSCNKLSSFTWKKRVSFGTSAPSDTHRPSEERLWPQKKECHILAGLKMLQRYSQKNPSCLHSKSGYKDYMKSNEGIYSLGTNVRKKSTAKPFQIGKLSRLSGSQDQILYDSDDAVESPCDLTSRHNICVKDCCNHNVSNTFCRWKCDQNDVRNVDQMRSNPTNLLTKDFTEKLLRFSNVFKSRKKACDNLSSTVLHLKADPIRFQAKPQMSETDELEVEPQLDSIDGQHTEQLEWDLKKLSKVDKPLTSQSGWTNHSQIPSTESKERPFSLFNPFRMNACLKENTMSIFDAGNEKPAELSSQHIFQMSEVQSIYTDEPNELPPLASLNSEKGGNLRNHSMLQLKERPAELQTQNMSCRTATGQNQCTGDSLRQFKIRVPEKQKPIRIRNTHDDKIQAVPPTHNCSKANIAKTHFQGQDSSYKVSDVTATEVSSSGGENTGFTTQKSPSSPPSKLPGFVSLARSSCSQSPKVSQPNNNLPSKNDGGTCSSSSPCDVQQLDSPTGKSSESFGVSCSTEAVSLNLVYNPSDQLQKSSSSSQIPTNGKPKNATKKLYNAPSPLGCNSDTNELSFKGLKNKSAPRVTNKVSPRQHSKKKVQTFESGPVLLDKTSSSLPVSVQDHFQYIVVSQEVMTKIPQPTSSCTHLKVDCQNSAENVSKTHIPLSLKGLVKSPVSLVKNRTPPLKHEKDHINTASKGKNALNEWDRKQRTQEKSKLGRRGGTRCNSMYGEQLFQVLPENSTDGEIVDRKSLKSGLASGKLDLKPALGMKDAKARSQSFSNRKPDKPSISTSGGVGKVQKRIIMNMGEKGNSLSRQHSFVNSFQLTSLSCPEESPADCPCSQADPHKLISFSSQSVLPVSKNRASNVTKNEANCPLTENEVHSFTFANKFGLKNSRQPIKALPHSSSDTLPFPVCQANEGTENPLQRPIQMDLVKNNRKQVNGKVSHEKPGTSVSLSDSTIEEKVMMGIEENMQKCQGQDKTQAPETKQKAALSLANWFGFRKSKLPALSGKKTDPPKGKQENTEAKTTSVVGFKQVKLDRKKDNKKNGTKRKDSEEVKISKASNKVDPVMGACNIHMGSASDQVQHQTSRTGKDPFMKDNVNRLPEVTQQTKNGSKLLLYKSESHGVPITNQDIRKKMSRNKVHVKTQSDSTAKTVMQKRNGITENEEQPTFKPTYEDHVIGMKSK